MSPSFFKYAHMVLRKNVRFPTAKNIHIMFREQAVCRRDTKLEKDLLDEEK